MRWRVSILTHTDLDGVSAAAIALMLIGAKPGVDARIAFVEPYNIHKQLKHIAKSAEKEELIVISDIGANPRNLDEVCRLLSTASSKGARVLWFDHHLWAQEWMKKVQSTGAKLIVDRSTCGAGVVAKYLPKLLGTELSEQKRRYIEDLVAATCAADIWLWDHPAAPKLYRVVDWKRGRAGDKWRRKLIEKMLSYTSLEELLRDEEVLKALSDYINSELRNYSRSVKAVELLEVNGCRVVVALKRRGPPSRSFLARTLLARYNAHVAAIIHSKGISLRSESVDVQRIARQLGGGGHPRAAGARLEMNPLFALIAVVYPKLRLRVAAKKLAEAIRVVGCVPLGEEGVDKPY